jgi:hypothetical protein
VVGKMMIREYLKRQVYQIKQEGLQKKLCFKDKVDGEDG